MICAHIAKDLLERSGGFFDRERLHIVDAEVGDLASRSIAEPGNEGTVLKNQKLSRTSSPLAWNAYRSALAELIECTLGTLGCLMTISLAAMKSASQMDCGEI